ncbi:sialate O-acetylesterase [soil metagenome]
MIILLPQTATLPFLSPALGSHMVLQRDRPNTLWGWTIPGSSVTVTLMDQKVTTTAGADGKWMAKINPPKVGGPYSISIDGTEHVTLDDVLVGDVWLCTGQSNMEFGLSLEQNAATEVPQANDPNLRLFMVPHQTAFTPQKVNGGTWKVCTPESVVQEGWGGFSAVGYNFGRMIRRRTGIPIGLIADNWGGTIAEAWTSEEGLKPLGDFDSALAAVRETAMQKESSDPGDAGNWQDPATNVSDWKPVGVTTSYADLGLANWDGTVWMRKEFVLTQDQVSAGAVSLSLGAIDDADTTWINGKLVGKGTQYNESRMYKVGDGTLKAGVNVLVVKVLDTGAFGGFSGPTDVIWLQLTDGTKLSMADGWVAAKGASNATSGPNVVTVLSNGMLEPQIPLGIKGAIWYQGESNADRAYQYRRLLPAMIGDWRKRFGQGDFPFYIVSLANFMAHKDKPSEDAWAELREAQAMTAANVKNSGLAVTIDVGDAVDIHPTDKKTVGERLALIALARDYGKNIRYQGPTYKGLTIKGSEAWVQMDHAEGMLSRGGGPGEFQVAGADHQWHWATAKIQGSWIIVSSPDVTAPVAVRYAWQANPNANVYNGAGLPAVPFRTDDWPGATAKNK